MPSARRSLSSTVADFFAVDDDWERPATPVRPLDVGLAAGLAVTSVVLLEMVRSMTDLPVGGAPVWVQWLAVVTGAALVIWRRTHPVLVCLLAAIHMFVVGVTMPAVMGQFSLQIVYFCAIYSSVAWAGQRRSALLVAGSVTLFMLLWVAWQFALGSGASDVIEQARESEADGWFDPVLAAVAVSIVVNVVYFVGAIVVGQIAWRGARQRARLEEQASTITAQAQALQRRAVVDERLRIARELHDVVGHHVSVIGIQAGAARRVLERRPEEAARALTQIEASSRDAVSQMRALLGTLRDIEATAAGDGDGVPASHRGPEPCLADLPTLVATHREGGLDTAYELVESTAGAHARVATPIGLTLYRVAQEALANVTRHSTATAADVVLRVVDDAPSGGHAEVEVVDNGRPRSGTSGSGLGQLGIRERAASHHGTVEIGPRTLGGYRVRVRIPLRERDVTDV